MLLILFWMKPTKFMEGGEMPTSIQTNLFNSDAAFIFLKFATLLILVFYAIFSLIIIRQVDLMGKTLVTGVSPLIKAIAIVHAGVAVGLIILAWGIL